jgi:AcrR family transcriptional regulator
MDPAERREQILATAMRLFEQHSYAEVATADIASAAGVARPLIHHYFGTKRELYLEVVRRLSYVPAVAVKAVSGNTLEQRVDAAITRWLTVAWRHRNMWISTVTMEAPDREVAQILRQADEIAADRMIEALGLGERGEQLSTLRPMILAYGGLAKAASRQWLVDQSLTREQVHVLLTRTLLTIVRDVVPGSPIPG